MSQDNHSAYSPVPKKRRGNRRASNNSPFKDELEPKIGINTVVPPSKEQTEKEQDDERARWLKAQKPPHWG